jgi:ABC transport system ATP-binding/permease protein
MFSSSDLGRLMIEGIAKISWTDPETNELREIILTEGVSLDIGRSQENEIYIPERHVSRKHAVIRYESGVFVIEDLGSANKTFVNDEMISSPYPLVAGDLIRLFKPEIHFDAVVTQEEVDAAHRTGTLLRPKTSRGRAMVIITTGPQEGMEIPLMQERVVFGRATNNATWDIKLQDHAVSRPHAELKLNNDIWQLTDMNSANGTLVNGVPIKETIPMRDGCVIVMGETTMLFKET